MKKTILLLLFILGSQLFAEDFYKEFPDGTGRWCNKSEYWYEYDNKGNIITIFGDNNRITWPEYDENNREIYRKDNYEYETWTEYDKAGNIIHIKKTTWSDKFDEWFYEYDKNGNLIYSKNPYDYETWTQYDSKGGVIYKKEEQKGSYAYELEYRYENKYDNKGHLIYSKCLDGSETFYEYDKNGKLIYKKNNLGETWYEYDSKGNLIKLVSSDGEEERNNYNEKNDITYHFEKKSYSHEEIYYEYEYSKKGQIIHKTVLTFSLK